jgi:hypothetical protein
MKISNYFRTYIYHIRIIRYFFMYTCCLVNYLYTMYNAQM